MNLSEALELFLDQKNRDMALSKGRASPTTQSSYQRRIEALARWIIGRRDGDETLHEITENPAAFEKYLQKLDVKSITKDEPADYLFECLQKGIEPQTVNSRLYSFKSFWKYLYENHDIENICDKIPRSRYQFKFKPHMKREHVTILAAYLDSHKNDNRNAFRNYMFFETIRLFGPRIGDTCSLDESFINFLPREIRIEFIVKGNKEHIGILPLYDEDDTPLEEAVKYADDLRHYLDVIRPQFKLNSKIKGNPVFLSQTGGRCAEGSMRENFKRTLNKCELTKPYTGEDYTPHSLRHSFVTELLAANVPIQIVKRAAGHSSVATTEIYAKTEEEDLRAGMIRGLKNKPNHPH